MLHVNIVVHVCVEMGTCLYVLFGIDTYMHVCILLCACTCLYILVCNCYVHVSIIILSVYVCIVTHLQ